MIIYVDIDNTICVTNGTDYENSIPIISNIKKLNNLHYLGHTLNYWTSRGSKSGIDWSVLTRQQLDRWDAKYTNLIMGKPYYDMIIEDKAFKIEEI